MKKPQLIFLSAHAPSLGVPEAGQKLAYARLRKLATTHDVHLVFFHNERDAAFLRSDDFSFCASVRPVRMTPWTKLGYLLRFFYKPMSVALRSDSGALKYVRELIASAGCKSIHIEYEQTGEFLRLLNDRGLQSTIVLHDVISQSVERYFLNAPRLSPRRAYYLAQLHLIRRWERRTLSLATRIVVLSQKDKDYLLENVGGLTQHSVVEIEHPEVADKFFNARRDRRTGNTLLFWGAMHRKENEDAVIWFVEKIFPRVLRYAPNATLVVLGANPSDAIRRLSSASILVTGYVDDPIPYFERATASIAPLRYGAGVKLKVLESLAAGLPVVGTSVAAEGINRKEGQLLVADDESAFANAVLKILGIPCPVEEVANE